MLYAILVGCALLGDDGSTSSKTAADRAAYESAQAQAGKDAAAHVRLVLWCEQHGLSAERVKHLALAIAYDPANVLARGLAGLVAYKGQWKKPEELGTEARSGLIREYLERRARAPHTADAQLRLAVWCAEKGLTDQALAHYTEVTRIDPTRDTAWKHLGYKKQGKRWVKPEDAAGQKLEAGRQKVADRYWKPRLLKLREGLLSASAARNDEARDELARIHDPRAIPTIMQIFARGDEPLQLAAVELLSQIEGPTAAFWLVCWGLDRPSPAVREQAAEAIKRRDPRDVIGLLISRVHRPYKYTIEYGKNPGSTGSLIVDGEQFDMQRFYRMPDLDFRIVPPITVGMELNQPRGTTPAAVFNPVKFNAPASLTDRESIAWQQQLMLAQAVQAALAGNLAMQGTMEADVRMLEELNAAINETNDRLLPLLKSLTGQEFGADPKRWQKWWSDQLGLVLDSRSSDTKPVFSETVALPESKVLPAVVKLVPAHTACFAAGTLVHTIDGPRPIESIQVGDSVLSQNTATGALEVRPVVAVHANKPNPTLKMTIGPETVVATGIHRFWKAGTGWTMARDLKACDRLRMVGGAVSIASIEPDLTQPVFNLDVADNRDFFVGKAGLLVHDFTFVQPTLAPFDGLPEVAAPERASNRTPVASSAEPR